MTALDPELCKRLAAECREDDRRMTPVPDPGQRAADNADGCARTRNNLSAIAEQLTAAVELTGKYADVRAIADLFCEERATLTAERDAARAERVRQVARQAYQAEMVARGAGAVGPQAKQIRGFVDAIADRVAAELAAPVTRPTEIVAPVTRPAETTVPVARPAEITELADAVRRLHETSERAPDVRAKPMRLVLQSALDALLECLQGAPPVSAPVLSEKDARELAERRSLDELRKEQLEELLQRRIADLSAEDRAVVKGHLAWLKERNAGTTIGTIHEDIAALLDRLLGGGW